MFILLQIEILVRNVGMFRVAKTLNSSYKPNPEILKLPTFSGMRRQNEETWFNKFNLNWKKVGVKLCQAKASVNC